MSVARGGISIDWLLVRGVVRKQAEFGKSIAGDERGGKVRVRDDALSLKLVRGAVASRVWYTNYNNQALIGKMWGCLVSKHKY